MSNGKPTDSNELDYDEERARAIEERIERLRRLHGWASDTVNVTPAEAEALRDEHRRNKAPRATLVLRYALPGGPQEKVEINEDHYDIGSGEKAKLRVLHPSVAARHARVSRDGDSFRVRDMNSPNGTYVNDSRIPLSSELTDGDVLRCGDIEFTITIRSGGETAAPAEAPAPSPSTTPAPRPTPAAPPPAAAAAREEEDKSSATMFVSRDEVMRRSSLRSRLQSEPGMPAVTAPAPAPVPAPAAAARVTPSAAFIVFTDADGRDAECEIPQDRPLVVGRRSSADLRLVDNSISGMHAAFEWADGEVVVRDLGSTNGTWMHGDRVPRAVLGDGDVVRLGLVPVRVRFVVEVAGESTFVGALPVIDDEDEIPARPVPATVHPPRPHAPAPVADEGPAAFWHLVYVTDRGAVTTMVMDTDNACVVAGEGGCEINVHGRGLKAEHLQFDLDKDALTVMQARRDAILKVGGHPVAESPLKAGDVVSAGSLDIRVVSGPSKSAARASAGYSAAHDFWAESFRRIDPALELLFVDPEATGGRAELSIWGDGAVQVDLHTGESSDRYDAAVDEDFQRALLAALTRAGFPDVPEEAPQDPGTGPELHAFKDEERGAVVISDWLATSSSAWREVRDLLRAVVDHIAG